MLTTWGGNGGDAISEEEFADAGIEKANEYCKNYCYYYGFGGCNICALARKRREMLDNKEDKEGAEE